MPTRRRTTRLFLLCHGPTKATRRAAFPLDEPVEPKGIGAAAALAAGLPSFARRFASPAISAQQTVAALGLTAEAVEALRDCGWGRWRGQTLDEVAATEPEAVTSWLADPEAAPHGGESVAALIRRVGGWMDASGVPGRVLAVTHPAVIRAALVHALGAPAPCFWRIDIPPLSIVELGYDAQRWRWRAGPPL